MKHQNMTFSIPEDLKANLRANIGKRGMSQFISNAIRKALEEQALKREEELDLAYEAANRDSDRLEAVRNWNILDDVGDLIDDDEDWSWLKNRSENGKS